MNALLQELQAILDGSIDPKKFYIVIDYKGKSYTVDDYEDGFDDEHHAERCLHDYHSYGRWDGMDVETSVMQGDELISSGIHSLETDADLDLHDE